VICLFVETDSLEWVHIPIQDETAPTVTQIQQFVSLIDKAEGEGTVWRLCYDIIGVLKIQVMLIGSNEVLWWSLMELGTVCIQLMHSMVSEMI